MSFFELRTPRDLLEKAHREHDRLTCAFNIDNVFNFFVTAFHIVHREPDRRTGRAAGALEGGRMEHPAQVLPDYASKAFYKARDLARDQTRLFDGMSVRQMPTLHEIRALSSHLYATAGYEVATIQELMAHTDPDMTRAYQKGHARKVLRVEMMLPYRCRSTTRRATD